MVAVNGWNESREVVARYVERAKLAQQVLLMGGDLAAQKFGVKSYPTSFLVDREGNVIAHHVGFDASFIPPMEREIVDALGPETKTR